VFSQTDTEALNFAWNNFGCYDEFQLVNIAHEYPEWKRHEATLSSPDVSRIFNVLPAFPENPPDTANDPAPRLAEKDQQLRTEDIEELMMVESLWLEPCRWTFLGKSTSHCGAGPYATFPIGIDFPGASFLRCGK